MADYYFGIKKQCMKLEIEVGRQSWLGEVH
jgi:hypothetical protein